MRAWVIAIVVALGVGVGVGDAYAKRRPPPPTTTPPPPPPVAKSEGYLVVYSTPFARIVVDGVDTKRTTPITARGRIVLAPGKHTLTFVVRTAGMEDRYTYSITIEAGKTTKVTKDLHH
jgi:hypothetical protein